MRALVLGESGMVGDVPLDARFYTRYVSVLLERIAEELESRNSPRLLARVKQAVND
jgi:hypothetical protein